MKNKRYFGFTDSAYAYPKRHFEYGIIFNRQTDSSTDNPTGLGLCTETFNYPIVASAEIL